MLLTWGLTRVQGTRQRRLSTWDSKMHALNQKLMRKNNVFMYVCMYVLYVTQMSQGFFNFSFHVYYNLVVYVCMCKTTFIHYQLRAVIFMSRICLLLQ